MTVLVVDDTRTNQLLMAAILSEFYTVKIAPSGQAALDLIGRGVTPDLILLDITMPDMDGYEVCRRLKANPETVEIPVVFLTGIVSSEDEEKAFKMGAVDYITKPIRENVLLARVKTQLQNKLSGDFLKDKAAFLEEEVARRTREVEAIQDVTILAMASLAETRDNETGNHIRRTQFYVLALAQQLKKTPRFSPYLNERTINLLFKSAPLHDIGKVGIPDNVLLKAGRLTTEEFAIIKTHTTLGRDAILHAEQRLGIKVDFLSVAKEIAYSHQEKYDGSGYPQGLVGEDIPISARIMAVADVYDALLSRRPYKDPMTHEEAVQIIIDGRGTHFDPDIVDAFLACQDEFVRISNQYADVPEDFSGAACPTVLASRAM
jgi:putative two-component system response regulator